MLRALFQADTVMNAILIGRQRRPDAPRPGAYVNPDFTPSDIFKLAERSGGEAVESRRVAESFQQMIERIRLRYSLQYEAPASAPGTLRHIRVELSSEARRKYPHAVIRARDGYYAR